MLKHRVRHAPADGDLGAAHLHRLGLEEFPGLDPRRLRQLPAHAERSRAPAADAACGREPVPSVPAVHARTEERWRRRWRCCTTSRWCSTARTRPSTATRISDTDTRQARLALLHRRGQERRSISAASRSHDLNNQFGVPSVDLLPYLPGRSGADRDEEGRGALPRLLPEVASAELLLLRGRARRLPGLAGAHAGHLQQVQQHRRPHRRLPLLHDLHQVRHRPRDLRRGAGNPLAATSRATRASRWSSASTASFRSASPRRSSAI